METKLKDMCEVCGNHLIHWNGGGFSKPYTYCLMDFSDITEKEFKKALERRDKLFMKNPDKEIIKKIKKHGFNNEPQVTHGLITHPLSKSKDCDVCVKAEHEFMEDLKSGKVHASIAQ